MSIPIRTNRYDLPKLLKPVVWTLSEEFLMKVSIDLDKNRKVYLKLLRSKRLNCPFIDLPLPNYCLSRKNELESVLFSSFFFENGR